MSESSKKSAGVGGGYGGLSIIPKSFSFLTGNLSGQDGTGFNPIQKLTPAAQNIRAETSDTLKRRGVGFRGL